MKIFEPNDTLREQMGFSMENPICDRYIDVKDHHLSMNSADSFLFKGDNRTWLESFSGSLSNSVDLIYIDPPYNTHGKFLYNDSRKGIGGVHAFGTHSAWMEFMYERLISAHKLLKNTGIIAISIDDYEQPYLRILMDNVFGEDNFIANIVVMRSKNGKGSSKNVSHNHEYLLVYGKSDKSRVIGMPVSTESYDKKDSFGLYKVDGLFRKKGDASLRIDRPNMFYPLYVSPTDGRVYTSNKLPGLIEVYPLDSKGVERRWLWGVEKATSESWKLYGSANGVIYVKNYYDAQKRCKPKSIWDDNRYLTERATNEIKEIFGDKIFDTPKPLGLIEDVIDFFSPSDAVVMDFFAGSGTTAHAVYNLNETHNAQRKVILVEDTQPVDSKHLSYKHGFRDVSDITVARLKYLERISNGRFSSIIV